MKIKLHNKAISEISSDIEIVLLDETAYKLHQDLKTLQVAGFEASDDNICLLHESKKLFVGLKSYSSKNLRSSLTAAVKTLKKTNYKSAKINAVSHKNIAAIVEGVILGGYSFNEYKSSIKKNKFAQVNISSNNLDFIKLQKNFNDALITAKATNFTRDLVNTTPQDLNPKIFAQIAHDLAKENNFTCNILDEADLENESMNAMLAVGRASINKSHLIHVSYKPENPKYVVSLVGKGLTYDSGGLSLKPATSMVTMKLDKSGGCTVLGILKAASELELDIEIHGFIGAVENMIGGDAYKPDDILTSRSGTTIEVRNTDAEGRLVLADVLSYAQEKVDSDYLFDFATLTGACMVALGQYTTGVMGHSNGLKHIISKAAKDSGELIGTLPFNEHLEKLLKSEIADISNVASKPYGGAITAALFLDKFIKDEYKNKWLHFDIAGSAYTEVPWDCNSYGGTGAGVRLMLKFLTTISEEN